MDMFDSVSVDWCQSKDNISEWIDTIPSCFECASVGDQTLTCFWAKGFSCFINVFNRFLRQNLKVSNLNQIKPVKNFSQFL